jgi:hypothetical protein
LREPAGRGFGAPTREPAEAWRRRERAILILDSDMGGADKLPFDIIGDANFVSDVSDVLAMINSYPTGRAVIGEVSRLGRIRVEPFAGGFNAETSKIPGSPIFWETTEKALIRFTPLTFTFAITIVGHTFRDPRQLFPGMAVDEVLIHEMVHAVNALGPGLNLHKPKGKMAVYDTYDDFYAITATNIYESEKGRPPSMLRDTHALTAAGMKDWEAISEIFLFMDGHFPWIKKFCEQNNHFAHMLARSHARFNPLRVYFALVNEGDDYEWPAPDLSDIPTREEISIPDRHVAYETRPPLSDALWIEILETRYRADDVAGYGARARRLQHLAASANAAESLPMFARLLLRPPGDRVAQLFHDNLSTALRKQVLDQLRRNLVRV